MRAPRTTSACSRSRAVWPSKRDPHHALLTSAEEAPTAGEEDLRRFLAECCTAGESELAEVVRVAFTNWCAAQALIPLGRNLLSRGLGQMGYRWRRVYRTGGHVYGYQGLAVLTPEFEARTEARTRRPFRTS